jgi:hypothetical protein
MWFSKQPKTQLERLQKLLLKRNGTTTVEIAKTLPSTTPTRRLSDLREKGWTITYKLMDDKVTKIYFGTPPNP